MLFKIFKSYLENYLFIIIPLAILVLFIRLNLNFNTPYLDEANYCFTGKLLIQGIDWKTKNYIFSSNIPLYFISFFDMLGGIIFSRFFSLILGFISIVFYFLFVKNTFNDKYIASISSFLLFISPSHSFISKIATYDIFAFLFFTFALYFFSLNKNYLSYVFFVLSILSKYITLLFSIFFVNKNKYFFILILSAFIFFYILYNYSSLLELFNNQIMNVHYHNTNIYRLIYLGTRLFLIPLIFFAFLIRNYQKKFFFFSLLIPIFHLIFLDEISFYKHVVYSEIFIYPIISSKIDEFINKKNNIIYILVILFFSNFYFNIKDMENGYPNTKNIKEFFSKIEYKNILSEDAYLLRYYLNDYSKIDEAKNFNLKNNYDYIYLNNLFDKNFKIKNSEFIQNNYKLVYSEKYKISDLYSPITSGYLEIYKKR